MKTKGISLILLIAFLGIVACNTGRKRPPNKDDMHFEVNEDLLGETQTNEKLGVAYAAPKNWETVTGEPKKKLSQTLSEMGATDDVQLLSVYFEQETASLLFVSDLSKLSDTVMLAAIANYKTYFADTTKNERVMMDDFEYNGFYIRQFLIQSPGLVNFKLWFLEGGKKRFQVDYMVPAEVYMKKIKDIESSIGSFHKLNY